MRSHGRGGLDTGTDPDPMSVVYFPDLVSGDQERVKNGYDDPGHPEIVYGPVVEANGSRVTRVRRVDESGFTVRVPAGAMASRFPTHTGWITEDSQRAVAASDRLLSAVLGASDMT